MPRIEPVSVRFMPRRGRFKCPLYAWKTAPDHTSLWKQAIYALRAIQEVGRPGKVQDGPLRPSGAILEAEKGYSARRRGLGTAFHPAGRVPEPEAFLARRIGRGYLLRLVEEDPA